MPPVNVGLGRIINRAQWRQQVAQAVQGLAHSQAAAGQAATQAATQVIGQAAAQATTQTAGQAAGQAAGRAAARSAQDALVQQLAREGFRARDLTDAIRTRRALANAWKNIDVGAMVGVGAVGGVAGAVLSPDDRFGGFVRGAALGAGAVAAGAYLTPVTRYLSRRGSIGTVNALRQLTRSEQDLAEMARSLRNDYEIPAMMRRRAAQQAAQAGSAAAPVAARPSLAYRMGRRLGRFWNRSRRPRPAPAGTPQNPPLGGTQVP